MSRLVLVSKLAVVLTQSETGSCQDAEPVEAVSRRIPSFRANSVAPFVPSPPVAGETTNLVFSMPLDCPLFLYPFIMSKSFFSTGHLQGRQERVKQLRVRGWANVYAKRERSIWILVMKRKKTKRNQR